MRTHLLPLVVLMLVGCAHHAPPPATACLSAVVTGAVVDAVLEAVDADPCALAVIDAAGPWADDLGAQLDAALRSGRVAIDVELRPVVCP